MSEFIDYVMYFSISVVATYYFINKLTSIINLFYYEGDTNEYVLVIRNGKLQKCGIGMHGYKMYYDQVATFPSRLNKVDFTAEQVCKEMQGIRVRGSLVWTINRNEDGPMKAYKNLGEDLKCSVPRQANEKLVSMCNAILRN